MDDQKLKADKGKPKISLVPMSILNDIAFVREYGVSKYKSIDSWKNVSIERYIDALLRHAIAFAEDPYGNDAESGLPHLWHIECNCAILSELMKGEFSWEEELRQEKQRKSILTVLQGKILKMLKRR